MSILSTPRQQSCHPHKMTKNVPALTSKSEFLARIDLHHILK